MTKVGVQMTCEKFTMTEIAIINFFLYTASNRKCVQRRNIHGSASEQIRAGWNILVRDLSDSAVKFSHALARHLSH